MVDSGCVVDFGKLKVVMIGGLVVLCVMIEWLMWMGVCVNYVWGMIEISLIGMMGVFLVDWDDLSFDWKVDVIVC